MPVFHDKPRWWGLFVLTLVFILVSTASQADARRRKKRVPAPPPPAPVTPELLPARYHFADADIGYIVFDPTNGHVITEHHADDARIPASTTKVVAAIAALKILGSEYRFETDLLTTGEVRDGALHGDLYLRGHGDPSLTTDDLRAFAQALQQAGVTHITGKFFYDESFLPRTEEIDHSQPDAVSYNPGLSALSVNYNRVQIHWQRQRGATGFNTQISSPARGGTVPLKAISTGVLTGELDRRITFVHDGGPLDRWLLSPTLPLQGWEELPVKRNPGQITAMLLQTICRQRGIDLSTPQAATTPTSARIFFIHQSEPLPSIVARTLRYSNNLSAELLGLAATRRLSGRPLSPRESAAVLATWYRQTLPSTTWNGFISANHSGLSTTTRHSPRQLAAILHSGWNLPAGQATFLDLLSQPGWAKPGSLHGFNVRAKSGTMSYADGLAGFLATNQGKNLGFVILITDFAKRAAMDATFDARFTIPSAEAQTWTRRAKSLERALVSSWIALY